MATSISTDMARSAKAAMLAAVEMYNKTAFNYREEVFCILIVNAWEVLAKARVVQLADDDLSVIHQPKKNRGLPGPRRTRSPRTIPLHVALTQAGVSQNVRTNVETLSELRNEVAHMGTLSGELSLRIGELGTASVQNFVKLLKKWFNEPIEDIYILPVGFIGATAGVTTQPSQRQRDLLHDLNEIVANAESDDDYSVSISVYVNLIPGGSGGGSIRPTNDPNAPQVQVDDAGFLEIFPYTYAEVVDMCLDRYPGLKRTNAFKAVMASLKQDAECAYQRSYNPKSEGSPGPHFYNAEAVFQRLDKHYQRRPDD